MCPNGIISDDDDLINGEGSDDSQSKDTKTPKRKYPECTSLEDLQNKNNQLAKSVSSLTQNSKKSDFGTQYALSVKEQIETEKHRLEFEKESKKEELNFNKEELEQNNALKREELEQNKTLKVKEQKGKMIENLAASGKSIEEIKLYLSLFDQL
jgi:hypothetical protein